MSESERPPVDPLREALIEGMRVAVTGSRKDDNLGTYNYAIDKAIAFLRDTPLLASPAAPRPEGLDVIRAALERLDAIARVDPRNEIGEAEFMDALGQSFTALNPGVRPVWRARLSATWDTES